MVRYISLTLIWLSTVITLLDAGNIPQAGHVSFTRPGDVIIGALFPMHSWSAGPPCSGIPKAWGNELVALLMFAIENVNKREDLLPNITIGFDIRDNCYSETMSIWSALALASTSEKPQEDIEFKKTNQSQHGNLLCIIGTESSSTSITAAQAASLYRIPVISPFATSNELSVKSRFPYFLRTVPPDNLQASAIIDILLRFEWKYIGLYFDLTSYGIHGAQALLDLTVKHDICVAFSAAVRPGGGNEEALLNLLDFPKARVVVMFMFTEVAAAILKSLEEVIDLPHRITFIASDGWSDMIGLALNNVKMSDLQGSIFLNLNYHTVEDFPKYYHGLQLSEKPFSPWFEAFKHAWMQRHDCLNFDDCKRAQIFANDNTLVDAVYAFAFALQNMLHDRCNSSVDCNSVIQTITGHDFYQYLLNVKFEGIGGDYSFNSKGDPGGNYKVYNIKIGDDGVEEFHIGDWIASSENSLEINTTLMQWAGGSPVPPTSLCRDTCEKGFIEVPLEKRCCLGCQRCPGNAVVVNGTSCEACPNDQWPDVNFIDCLPIIPTPPNWSDPVVIVILILSGFGLVLSGLAAVGLYYYRQNVLIKAASRELSSINIMGLTLAFLSPFPLLVPPTDVSCRVSEIIVSLCITLTYAPTLLKVNRIYRIFEAGRKSNKCPRFIGSRPQLTILLSVVAVVIFISVVGTLVHPTVPAKLFFSPPTNYIEAYCEFGNGFLASIIYNLLLILACCYYAFKSRKVPSNYNESKFIAVSVYSTLVFSVAAVAVYITAAAVLQKVATICIAILLTSIQTLIFVYLPKLYAILLAKDVELCEWRANTSSTDTGTSSVAFRRGTAQVGPQPAPDADKQVDPLNKDTP